MGTGTGPAAVGPIILRTNDYVHIVSTIVNVKWTLFKSVSRLAEETEFGEDVTDKKTSQ